MYAIYKGVFLSQKGTINFRFSKTAAKVLLFHDMCKYFQQNLVYVHIFLYLCTLN